MARNKYRPPHVKELRISISCFMWAWKEYLALAYRDLGLEIDWKTVIHYGLRKLEEELETKYNIKVDRESILKLQEECEAESRPAV